MNGTRPPGYSLQTRKLTALKTTAWGPTTQPDGRPRIYGTSGLSAATSVFIGIAGMSRLSASAERTPERKRQKEVGRIGFERIVEGMVRKARELLPEAE